ncbi:MAG TPA: rod shape-determining protein [Acidimicrobiia bacterium]|nr:rod shape-determining protein [Acidimicrobiia bacterium]
MEGRDTAIDLGTSTTTVFLPGRGVVLEEPSLVALTTDDGRPVAVGSEAHRMLGRTPASIEVVRPVRHGVIADVDVCTRMLRYMLLQVHPRRWSRPKTLVSLPSGLSPVEQRVVQEAVEEAGGRRPVQLVEAHIAAALGVGLPIHEARGSMVVVVGGGRTEVAVMSLGGNVARKSLPLGGLDFDQAIVEWVKKEHGVALGERTAEELKIQVGSAGPARPEAARASRDDNPDSFDAQIRGRDLVTGLPRTIMTSTAEIQEALEGPVTAVVDAVKEVVDATPPELAADIMEHGVALTGGGALLRGLDQRLADETGLPVMINGNPMHAVARGAAHCLAHLDACRTVLVDASQL